jgi:putative metallohydrolase (TIGR04338 family)
MREKKMWPHPLELKTLHEMGTRILADNAYTLPLEIRDGRGRRTAAAASYMSSGVLWMPRMYRSVPILLHELAHLLVPRSFVAHGPEFCRMLIRLVERYMGQEEAAWLLEAYQAEDVQTVPLLFPSMAKGA